MSEQNASQDVRDRYLYGPGISDNSSADAIIHQITQCKDPYEAVRYWSYLDEDVADAPHVSELAKRSAIAMREDAARTDWPRIKAWKLPENVVSHLAIAYADGNDRGHYLDVFAPSDASAHNTYPVVIDDHGGGFVYGLRELNRSFAMHLASRGYVVVLPSYRPGPRYNFAQILCDLSLAYSWTLEHIAEYGGDVDRLFMTGDSAGGCMALHSTLIENFQAMSDKLGVPQAGLNVRGLLLVCGIYNLELHYKTGTDPREREVLKGIAPEVFASVADRFVPDYMNMERLVDAAVLPPVFINTASDDFLRDENYTLKQLLEARGVSVVYDEADAATESAGEGELGHVYVVGKATHPRSVVTLDKMDAFMREILSHE